MKKNRDSSDYQSSSVTNKGICLKTKSKKEPISSECKMEIFPLKKSKFSFQQLQTSMNISRTDDNRG
jgi:hypothetical protein